MIEPHSKTDMQAILNDAENIGRNGPLLFFAQILFMLLLAGYFIFNRTFALVGFPPLYVGEMVLGFIFLLSLSDLKRVYITPFQNSLAMRLIALFFAWGLVEAALDGLVYGVVALRDSVMCLYAIVAFFSSSWLFVRNKPAKWQIAIRNLAPHLKDESLQANRWRVFLKVIAAPAIVWGLLIYEGWITAPASVKVDFLTLSAAISSLVLMQETLICWGLIVLSFEMRRRQDPLYPKIIKAVRGQLRAIPVFVLATILLVCLPTRAVQFSFAFVMFSLILIGSIKLARRRNIRLGWIAIAMIVLLGATGLAISQNLIAREKIEAAVDPNDSHFATRAGQLAAHSTKWRLIFWKHCVEDTLHTAPIFGLGFGVNLTDLMRDTPDWELFADSQNAEKYGSPNRHPHSAHVSVFVRLGIAGFLVWAGILTTVFIQGVKNWGYTYACVLELSPNSFYTDMCAVFNSDLIILAIWVLYVLTMSFGVVLENPFGGIWFWALTGVIANRRSAA